MVYGIMRGWRDVESKGTFLELFERKDEDVWLWRDGDEEVLPEPDRWWTAGLPFALAANALQTRQASRRSENREMAEMRQRLQSESFAVRQAAIAWLVCTSKTMKKWDSEHGRMDSEERDLWGLIWGMYDVRNELPEASTEEFEKAMKKEGHTCHTELPYMTAERLYMQYVLFPERAGAAVNLKSIGMMTGKWSAKHSGPRYF